MPFIKILSVLQKSKLKAADTDLGFFFPVTIADP